LFYTKEQGVSYLFGENIRKIRKQKDLSINNLSEKSGVAQGYLSDLENNKLSNPTLETLNKIALALGVSLKDLVSEDAIDINSLDAKGLLDQEMMWAYLIKAAEHDTSIKKVLNQALGKEKSILKLSCIVLDFLDKEGNIKTSIKYDFGNNTVSHYDKKAEAEERKQRRINTLLKDKTLDDEEILTLAAHMFGHEGPLTQEERDKMALAIKIALAKNNK